MSTSQDAVIDGDDGEYADLFESSGEEYRSDEDIYADDEDNFGSELRVSSAIAADMKHKLSENKSSKKKAKQKRTKNNIQSHCKK